MHINLKYKLKTERTKMKIVFRNTEKNPKRGEGINKIMNGSEYREYWSKNPSPLKFVEVDGKKLEDVRVNATYFISRIDGKEFLDYEVLAQDCHSGLWVRLFNPSSRSITKTRIESFIQGIKILN